MKEHDTGHERATAHAHEDHEHSELTAEALYLVIPQRPAASFHLSESELADLVTRDSMIGTGLPLEPPPLLA